MASRFEDEEGVVTETVPKQEKKTKRPKLYKVLIHNDDYTTREFVVEVLKHVFRRSETEAVQIMLHVHNTGVGVAGVYSFEIAETKVRTVEALARQNEFPLLATSEPEN